MSNTNISSRTKILTRETKKFYEKYQFPGNRPIERDGIIFLRNLSASIKNLNAKRKKIRILDAGCGTGNTTISLAETFKDVKFFGIDNSSTSILVARKSLEKKGLSNTSFRHWNLNQSLPFKTKFNIIYCLGVLHHTADMKLVLRNLYNSLAKYGELYLWIYAKYGRYYHTLNLKLLRMLIKTKPEVRDDISFIREFITGVKNNFVLKDLLKDNISNTNLKKVFLDKVWIADQFINPIENLLDMKGLIKLIEACGFKLQKVLGISNELTNYFSSENLLQSFIKLNKKEQMIALDLLLKPERHFVILKK